MLRRRQPPRFRSRNVIRSVEPVAHRQPLRQKLNLLFEVPDPENYVGEDGFTFSIQPAIKSVTDGIDFIKSQTVFTNENNVNLNNEASSYKWKEDSNGDPIEGEPVKFHDHAMDATRYGMYSQSLSTQMKMAFV